MVEGIANKPWIGWALVASFGLNLFFGGFIIARVLTPPETDETDFQFAVASRILPQHLPAEVREDLEDEMRLHRREMKQTLKALREKQQEISTLFGAEHLDSEALAEAYEDMRQLNAELQGPIQDAFIAAASDMDEEMRRIIIDIPEIRIPAEIGTLNRIDGARWRFERDGDKFEIIIGGEDGDEDSMFVTIDATEDSSDDEKDGPDN